MSQTTGRWLTWAWYLMRIWAFSLYVLAWSDTRIAVKITNNAIKYYSVYVLGLLYLLEDSIYMLLMNNHLWWYIGCMLLPCLVEFFVTDKKLRRPRLYVTISYTRRWFLLDNTTDEHSLHSRRYVLATLNSRSLICDTRQLMSKYHL